MALSASQHSAKNQNIGSNQRKTTRVNGRCHHCGKFGHKKVDCRNWLNLTKEEQAKADKEQQEKSEEKPKKDKEHTKCFNCNTMGHYTSECSEKKSKDSSGGSSGGFATMCFKINESPVEGGFGANFSTSHRTTEFGSSFRSRFRIKGFGSSFRS